MAGGKREVSPKHRTPRLPEKLRGLKHQPPSPKHQSRSKHQMLKPPHGHLEFGVWDFSGVWRLEFRFFQAAQPNSEWRIKVVRILFAFGAAVLACLMAGCGTTRTIMVGEARPAISPAAVRVYEVLPRHYERIAIINSSGGTSWIFPDRDSMDTAIVRLRETAAGLGANGVLLQEVYDESAGGLSIGIGGFGFGGGRHNFYAGGGSATVGGPLINRRVQATAIYVR
jgi:hypothetical protein